MSSGHHALRAGPGSLFWRLWLRALTVKRLQAGLAIGSLLVGAAVTSMLLNLYGDVHRKMTREFRAYGANVVVAPSAARGNTRSAGNLMDEGLLEQLKPGSAASRPCLCSMSSCACGACPSILASRSFKTSSL